MNKTEQQELVDLKKELDEVLGSIKKLRKNIADLNLEIVRLKADQIVGQVKNEKSKAKSDDWQTEFPKGEGKYWFYGYRYGKVSCGKETEPELMYVEVYKCANGLMHEANGQWMYESEVECPHFKKVDLPELPNL